MSKSEAAEIYIQLGKEGAERYAKLSQRAHVLLSSQPSDNAELIEVNKSIYELLQEAGLVSNR
jgi:hypothetical protein